MYKDKVTGFYPEMQQKWIFAYKITVMTY